MEGDSCCGLPAGPTRVRDPGALHQGLQCRAPPMGMAWLTPPARSHHLPLPHLPWAPVVALVAMLTHCATVPASPRRSSQAGTGASQSPTVHSSRMGRNCFVLELLSALGLGCK